MFSKMIKILFSLLILHGIRVSSKITILEGYQIYVEKTKISDRAYLKEEIEEISNSNQFYILRFLSRFDWVRLGCVLSPTELLLSEGRISPYYRNVTEDTYTCFTKTPKDLVFGSIIDGTKIFSNSANAIKNEQNLIKGFYMGKYKNCVYYLTNTDPLWVSVDFGKPRRFTTVAITTLFINDNLHKLKAGKIWIGNSSTSNGDFSGFELFASYPDFTEPGQTMTFKKENSVTAQYVGIKQNSGVRFYLCYFLVY